MLKKHSNAKSNTYPIKNCRENRYKGVETNYKIATFILENSVSSSVTNESRANDITLSTKKKFSMNNKLTAKAFIQIQKSPEEIFEAIINPEKMQHYFASGTATMAKGKTVDWWFPEFPDRFPVVVKDIIPYSYISFDWSGGIPDMLVEIKLEVQHDGSTVVRIEEHQMEFTPEDVEKAIQQTGGWSNFLASLKAYLEYGIHLRRGAFDFMKPSN